ncbi:MAG: hypothetical protein DRI01_09945 [Chloroflexi bacterium]|nr:MAG: hypothetical protein DRI01_09945 [Chloroflexota bacterium]
MNSGGQRGTYIVELKLSKAMAGDGNAGCRTEQAGELHRVWIGRRIHLIPEYHLVAYPYHSSCDWPDYLGNGLGEKNEKSKTK